MTRNRSEQPQEFEYWDFPAEASVREPVPSMITEADRLLLEELLRTSTNLPSTEGSVRSHRVRAFVARLFRTGANSPNAGGEKLFITLGLDMGTSTTKIIVRMPYETGEPIAIPAPAPCRSGNASYLWRTVLWLLEDGAFCPWPVTGATVLTSLKQGLIRGDDSKMANTVSPDEPSRAEAAVAYLAFVIRYVRGWLLRNRPNLFRGRKPIWFVNLGIPAASYDDVRISEPYRRVGAAALLLAKSDESVTVETTRHFLCDPYVVNTGASEKDAEELGLAVIPETAAQMTGFSKSARKAAGLYLLVDVGALTLDACMFRLNQTNDFGSMEDEVRPLGVESFYWFLSKGKTEPEFQKQCDYMLRSVVWKTKQKRDPNAMAFKRGNDVPVFLAGGGAANLLHQKIVKSLGPWLQEYTNNDGIRLIELPVPKAIDLPDPIEEEDFRRMVVAYGLSYPPEDIGGIRPKGEIEDVPPLPVAPDYSGRFVSKDQV